MVVLEKEKKVKNENERSKFIQLLKLAFDYAFSVPVGCQLSSCLNKWHTAAFLLRLCSFVDGLRLNCLFD